MKKSLFLIVILINTTNFCISQNWGNVNVFFYNQEPSDYALQIFNKVLASSDYEGPDITLKANYYIPNAMAISEPIFQAVWNGYIMVNQFNGYKRYMLYNPNFMTQIQFGCGNEFVALSIFAHELGHHKYNHCDNSQDPWLVFKHPWQKEWESDYYSGFILAKLGADSSDLQISQRLMFSMWGSLTHPNTVTRIQKISEGYRDGGGIDNIQTGLMNIYKQIMNDFTKWHQ
ncbi:MAG: hypothetical protein EPN82_02475 [Bacteroidetes bacterium]|nr:MAG: hypothetical protein EPN82_02475 [Bacteroidota bacterium]